MNDWNRRDSFWDIAMNIKEAMERSIAARISAYVVMFMVGLCSILNGVLGPSSETQFLSGGAWVVIGLIFWVVLAIDIIANYLRNSGRW